MAQDLLELRFSTPLFRLGSAAAINAKVSFPVSRHGRRAPGRHRHADRRHRGRRRRPGAAGRGGRLQRRRRRRSRRRSPASPARCSSARCRRTAPTASSSQAAYDAGAAALDACRPARWRSSSSRTDSQRASRSSAHQPLVGARRSRPLHLAARVGSGRCARFWPCSPPAYVGRVTTRESNDMTYRQLGDSGLTVSTVGLGCNNFGRRLDQEGTHRRRRHGDRRRHHALRHRRHLRAGRERGAARCRSRHAARRASSSPRSSAWTCRAPTAPTGGCAAPAATSARRSRPACAGSAPTGSTSTSCTGPTRRRRSTRRSPPSTSSCARARCATSAAATSPAGRSSTRTGRPGRAGTERFISAQNEYSLLERDVEDGARARVRARRRRPAAVLPAGLGPAHRQVPPRRGGARGHPPRVRWATGSPPPTGTRSSALEAYAAERGLRPIDVAIGGLAAQPAVASVIAGATRPEQVVDNVRAGLWQPTRRGPRRARRDHPALLTTRVAAPVSLRPSSGPSDVDAATRRRAPVGRLARAFSARRAGR